jgi:Tol biopolymer transport system component
MQAPDASAVRNQLEHILASPVFAKSPRMRRFLKFVVEETLNGRSDRIKEYAIALEVFDKNEKYDPQADSTVRTEASKLRTRLTRYYESEGREDTVVISIPKGSYIPVFDVRPNKRTVPATTNALPFGRAAYVAGAAIVAGGIWLSHVLRSPVPAPRLIPLTSFPELEEYPSVSPDGSQVAFTWKGDIFVKQMDGEGLVQVTTDPGLESRPSWSPDGRQIAFVRDDGVFLVSALGGGERKVAESAGPAVWMPDGSGLLITSRFAPTALSIVVVSLADGQKRRLTFPHDRSMGDVDMAVSPDGRTLAFKRVVVQNGEIYVVPITGGEARQLTRDNRMILGLTWTPDGREIVFSSARTGWSRLWRISAVPPGPAAGFATPRPVEGAGDDARFPWISRSQKRGASSRLVYQRYTRNFDIRRAEITGPEGSPEHRLAPSFALIASTRMDFTPAISPDGKKIAFVSDRSGARELWICDFHGSNAIKLTSFAGPDVVHPRWSSDGRRLIFSALSGPKGNFESYTIGVGGGAPQRFQADGDPSIAHPILSVDGRWLYFIHGPLEGTAGLWRMPSTGGKPDLITKERAFRPEESLDGKVVFYGKLGTNGLWSVPADGGEERQVLDSVMGRNWTVTPKGIYYFDSGGSPGTPGAVKFYNLKTGAVNAVGAVESTVSTDFSGMSVSPDGRWLLYSHVASTGSDLMLLDGFR